MIYRFGEKPVKPIATDVGVYVDGSGCLDVNDISMIQRYLSMLYCMLGGATGLSADNGDKQVTTGRCNVRKEFYEIC